MEPPVSFPGSDHIMIHPLTSTLLVAPVEPGSRLESGIPTRKRDPLSEVGSQLALRLLALGSRPACFAAFDRWRAAVLWLALLLTPLYVIAASIATGLLAVTSPRVSCVTTQAAPPHPRLSLPHPFQLR